MLQSIEKVLFEIKKSNEEGLIEIQKSKEELLEIKKSNEELKTVVYLNSRNLVALAKPKPISTSSARINHQKKFKSDLIQRYNCHHPSNPNIIKCMVLGQFFFTSEVIAGHILGLNQAESMNLLGLTRNDIWNPKNGVLWHSEIEKKYSAQEIVSNMKPSKDR